MDELLAIICIVILCCLMFFAWLISMATCPDTMVALLSGTKADSAFSSSHESKELIGKQLEERELASSVSSVYLPINSARVPASDKKLSVVPEQDEQLTVQSTIHAMRPSILKIQQNTSNLTPTVDETVEPMAVSGQITEEEKKQSNADICSTSQLPETTQQNDGPTVQEVL
ncbi:hypothetical protein WR25_23891 [Diploscapter pachys]|uniref:Uncharacterized protein n=1 Tax=Diploscapter pachys TaxID=2018661 RepID=A0A2A2L0Y5_9BILA|nr:hypothetical protein WR25_23891 [Diploscapter pachys]